MDKSPLASNPFALMMNPDAVLAAMASSDRLSCLQRRICKPLDKPMIPKSPDELASFDHEVEESDEPSQD